MMRILEELRRLLMMLGSQGLWLTLLAGIDKAGRWLTGRPVWRFSRITPQIVQPAGLLGAAGFAFGFAGLCGFGVGGLLCLCLALGLQLRKLGLPLLLFALASLFMR